MNIAIFGATGQVGTVMRTILEERNFPVDRIRYFASSKSVGKVLQWKGYEISVEDAASGNYSGIDIALFSAGATAYAELAPKVAAQGAIVIDNSSAWRMDPEVPLVVPEVNGHALAGMRKGIIANPNCTTIVTMSALKALDKVGSLKKLVVSTYQAVSGAGLAGVNELVNQLSDKEGQLIWLAYDGRSVDFGKPSVFVGPIAANVLPIAGTLVDEETNEEHKFRDESRKILELPNLEVSVTCVRVPVFTGHSVSIYAELEKDISTAEATAAISKAPGVKVVDVPTPLDSAGRDYCLVGRIRKDPGQRPAISLFVTGDNLRKGAALNAIQIAESFIGS